MRLWAVDRMYGQQAARRRPRRRRPEVYRRRRVTALVGVSAVVLSPLWLFGGGDAGELPLTRGTDAGDANDGAAVPAATCATEIDDLELRARLALLLMVGVDGDAPDEVAALLEGIRPGGVFVRPGQAVWEERAVADRADDGLPLLVALDDEGGRVQPLAGVLADLGSARSMTATTPEEIESRAAARGQDLRDLGINVAFAPVADVGGGGGIGDRSFGDAPDVVTDYAGAYARGLRSVGVLPVLKHFPGHGRAGADTHDAPAATPDLEALRTVDLRPYETLLGDVPVGVMVGHLDVPGLTAEGIPASLSPDAIGLLRAAYEFDGLVVTDDLAAMRAITTRFDVPDAAERALAAGVDVLLLSQPTDVGAVLDRLVEAVEEGRIPERRLDASLARVAAAAGCEGAAG